MESLLIDRLSTLSHAHRLAVFRLLIRRCPDEVPAGEITQALGLKPSTASTYFSTLTKSGLITQTRDGTRLLYAVNLEAVRDVIGDLVLGCCQGRADLCPPEFADLLGGITAPVSRPLNVLFVCTGNSARSIFAEALLRDQAGDRFAAYSAGTAHRSEVNPSTIQTLRAKGHDVSRLRPKHVDAFRDADAPKMDFVFTVCDHAANEECPPWPGAPLSAHWGMPDPVKADVTDEQSQRAFHQTYTALRRRIAAFADLPFDTLDRGELQQRVDHIGATPLT